MKLFVTGGSGFIGTHFIERVLRDYPQIEIANADNTAPKLDSHKPYWRKGSIMDAAWLAGVVRDFQPTHICHLAAKTDMEGKTVADYAVNVEGTANLLAALAQVSTIERAMFVSSQYVVGPGELAKTDWEHRPHTIYGESKCRMEDLILEANLPYRWTVVRPTNVWGAWHPRYSKEIWLVLKRGFYLHPGGKGVFRAYGYVGNVADQTWKLMNADPALVNRKPFYVGDPVDDILKWTTAFSVALCSKKPYVVPRPILRSIALVGDVSKKVGYSSFPLFSSRFRSMTQDYLVDMEPTYRIIGRPEVSLEQGVKETVNWLKLNVPSFAENGR